MKYFIFLLVLILGILTYGQNIVKPSKKDCYKQYETHDTIVKNIVWRDSTNTLKWTPGLQIIHGTKLTCISGYDSIYSVKTIAIDGSKLYNIPNSSIFYIEDLKR